MPLWWKIPPSLDAWVSFQGIVSEFYTGMSASQERLPRQRFSFSFLFLTHNPKKTYKLLFSHIHSSPQTCLGSILIGISFLSFPAPHLSLHRNPICKSWQTTTRDSLLITPSNPSLVMFFLNAHFSTVNSFSKTPWGGSLCGYSFSVMNELFMYVTAIHKKKWKQLQIFSQV